MIDLKDMVEWAEDPRFTTDWPTPRSTFKVQLAIAEQLKRIADVMEKATLEDGAFKAGVEVSGELTNHY